MDRIEWVATMHQKIVNNLWYFLRGVSDDELDWKIHPEANTVRRILSHLLFIEEWTTDAIADRLTPATNHDPKTYPHMPLAELRERFDAAVASTQAGMRSLDERHLERKVDMLGVMTAKLLPVLENHVTHTAGHVYQVRFIRGTFSRAHGTEKAAFDPW